jgi:hypothetical protein
VLLDTSGASGELVKFLRVMSNDPTNSNVPLYLGGIVWQPIDAIPKVAGFLFGPDAYTNQTRVVRLVSNLEESVEISAPVWNDASIQAELKTLREGKEFELIVTRLVPTEGEGSHTIPITLKTSSPRMPVVTVSTYTTILPAVKLAPPRALLSQSPLTNAEQLTVTVRNQSTNAITLTEPSLNAEGASIELRETRKGREFELVMNFPAGFVLQSEARLEARVKSSSPRAPVIKVPISLAGADAEPGGLAAMLAAEAAAEAASKADGKPSGESGTGKAKKD